MFYYWDGNVRVSAGFKDGNGHSRCASSSFVNKNGFVIFSGSVAVGSKGGLRVHFSVSPSLTTRAHVGLRFDPH